MFCILCERPIMGAPALAAYPSNGPSSYYCEDCAAIVYQDACVGRVIRMHDKEKYNDIRQYAHIIGTIAAGIAANDESK